MTSETRGKPRARDLGLPFPGIPGRWNAITDVPGVEVGYTTLIKGEGEVQKVFPREVEGGYHAR